MKGFENGIYVLLFGSFGDCLQAFHWRRVDVVKIRELQYSRVWNEQLKWLLYTRPCSQVLGAIDEGHVCAYSRCEIAE